MSTLEAFRPTLDAAQAWQDALYRHLHAHPELSMREHDTAAEMARRLAELGYEVHEVGGGVVGVLRNGEGRSVLFRADMDGLPITEDTGLDYASTVRTQDIEGNPVGVMHACGHDVHMVCALGAFAALAAHRDAWSGTVIALFQPGEETLEGARAMVVDGLGERIPTPDVALAQHVLPDFDAGHVASAPGPVLSASTSIKITLRGLGSHGSMPHVGVDPILMAAEVISRLHTIVSREIAPHHFGVVTVGSVHAGHTSNTIPDRAELLVSLRAYQTWVRDTLRKAVERVVRGECLASGTPLEPTFEYYDSCPATDNDPKTEAVVRRAFIAHFGVERVHHLPQVPAREDFSIIPDAFGTPYTYWGIGGVRPGSPRVPNHDANFAPVMHPTLRTGTEAALVAMLAFLGS